MELNKHETLYYRINNNKNIQKIAAFDIDSTIIKPKSGKKFAKNADDWMFLSKIVPITLQKLNEDNYTIVFFTNQMGISRGKVTLNELSNKFNAIINELDIKIDILISSADDYYRKPHTGMWDFYKSHLEISNNILSFYCGDAAGRKYKTGKDFSSSDKYFAYNIGLEFKLPEDVFNLPIPEYSIISPYDKLNLEQYQNNIIIKQYLFDEKAEMILLVGKPASGKTTFCNKYYPKYTRINMDILKTKAKCVKATNEAIKNKHNIVIDNTNSNKDVRKIYLDIAKKHNMLVKIYVFEMSIELCKHLNAYRVQRTKGKTKKIPKLVYNIYNKKYEEPTDDEGKIIKVNFVLEFENEDAKREYYYKYDIN
jgi:bifunctional polynucleotide phosphatase/kinase